MVNPGSTPGVRPGWLVDLGGPAPLKRISRFPAFIATLLAIYLARAACMAAMAEHAHDRSFIGKNALNDFWALVAFSDIWESDP
jgi:hypothetical protein